MRNLKREKRLSFKKFQVSKIKNPQYIFGGNNTGDNNDNTIHGITQRPKQGSN